MTDVYNAPCSLTFNPLKQFARNKKNDELWSYSDLPRRKNIMTTVLCVDMFGTIADN